MNRDVCEHFNPVDLPCAKCGAEPVQEPVAWRWGYRSVTTGEMEWRGYVEIAAHPNLRSPAIIMQPLYIAPPQRPAEPVQEPDIAQQVVSEQAEDEGLWFVAVTASEAYLQQALRRLHAAVEGEDGQDAD